MNGRLGTCGLGLLLALLPASAFARTAGLQTQLVPAARITALAERVARAQVSDPNRALAAAAQIADQRVPLGVLTIEPERAQVNSSYISVPVEIRIDGQVARTVFAGFRITSYVQMPVAAHDLAADAILTADDLTYVRQPYTGRPALAIETFVGRKVRSIVPRGDCMYPELTVVNEIVRAGMPAVLIVHDGSVRIAADVVARTSGGLGEYVTVFNPQTQRSLSGVVTGPNTVELTLPGAQS